MQVAVNSKQNRRNTYLLWAFANLFSEQSQHSVLRKGTSLSAVERLWTNKLALVFVPVPLKYSRIWII